MMHTGTFRTTAYILVAALSSVASLQDAAARESSAAATVGTDAKTEDGEQMPWKLPMNEQSKK